MTRQTVKKRNSAGLTAAILTMSFMQMTTNAVGAVLAQISAEFPGVPAAIVQCLMTFPNLLVVGTSVLSAFLAAQVSKRILAAVGLALGMAAGVVSLLCHDNLPMLFVGAGLLGIGIGMIVPVATSLISDYFDGAARDTLLGRQTAAANVGSMLMTFLGGVIAAGCWYRLYLVYFLALPGFVLTLLFVPRQNAAAKDADETDMPAGHGVPRFALPYFAAAAVFMLLFYIGPSNLSMLIQDRSIGGASAAGTASAILLLGGTVMGAAFGPLAARIGKGTIPLGFAALTVGYLLIFSARTMVLLCIGSFIAGMGNPLVLPQCMGSVATHDKRQSTLLMSGVFAIANLGTFFSPMLTGLCALVMGKETPASRFLFAAVLAAGLAAAEFLYQQKKGCGTV